ncbi:flagellar basal-body rod protein FlgF [Govanella unica]|uniref:Flagellar basal-body rod protein FlgF n=1 Tax=Govanella unica TaxID=2975056 RepID=A0A9X3Z6P0_9PROT|nr:flagellar basal-body rod protein FlgF [Govania unica]MDA5193218.1 flagellar basal-body rod protein FlgF [Govania unica]
MDVSLYVGLSHQMAMRRNIDIIANNMANMNTTSFKKEAMIFQEYMVTMKDTAIPAARKVSYVQDKAVIRDFIEGKFRPTENPLDLSLNGQNFFQVRQADGSIRYTRNGHFSLSPNGTLVTSSGLPVLDRGGSTIQFLPEDNEINVAPDGTVSTKSRGDIGQISVVSFANLGQLEKTGDSLFSSPQTPTPSQNYSVMRGMIEDSNVEPIIEMTNMINVSRQYQMMARSLEDQQDLYSKSINRLAKVG